MDARHYGLLSSASAMTRATIESGRQFYILGKVGEVCYNTTQVSGVAWVDYHHLHQSASHAGGGAGVAHLKFPPTDLTFFFYL